MAHLHYGRSSRVPDRTDDKRAAPLDEPAARRQMEVQVPDVERRIALMERMITDFERMAADLDRDILINEERANTHDLEHFTYLTCAKAIALRRDNLRRSAGVLRAELSICSHSPMMRARRSRSVGQVFGKQ